MSEAIEPRRRAPGRALLWTCLLLTGSCQDPEPGPEAGLRLATRPLALASGLAAETALTGGGTHHYRLDLASGQFAALVVDQRGIDVVASLLGPDGRRLTEVDSPNGAQGPEPLPVIGEGGGPLVLEVRSTGRPEAIGRYALRIEELRPATARDRLHVAAERTFARAEAFRRRRDARSLRAAAEANRQALALFRILQDPSREADVLDRLGRVHLDLGEREAALGFYRQALPLLRSAGRSREIGAALNGLGLAHRGLGLTAEALACYQEALALQRSLGDRAAEGKALNSMGQAYFLLGETGAALHAYENAVTAFRTAGDDAGAALSTSNLGALYIGLGQPRQAVAHLEKALPRLLSAGLESEAAVALTNLGRAQAQLGGLQRGIASIEQALALQRRLGDRRNEAVTLSDLAILQLESGRREDARRGFTQALALFRTLGNRRNEAVGLANLAWLENRADRPAAAAATFRQALPLFREAGDREGEAATLLGLAHAGQRLGDLPGARALAFQALDRIESLRGKPQSGDLRASFFATKQEYYSFAVNLAMELDRRDPAAGHAGEAFETSERARARSLLDALAEAGAGRGGVARPARLDEVQRLLDRETLLLAFALGEPRSFLWAVTPGSVEAFELPPRAVLEEAARRSLFLAAASGQALARAPADTALATLSDLLLRPVSGLLKGKRLLIVADGALHSLPFAALPEPGQGAQAPPLAAGHEIVLLPSASSLAALRHQAAGRPPPPATLAVLADPVFDAADPRVAGPAKPGAPEAGAGPFPRLPSAGAEAAAILALVPQEERFAALGFAATRETALSGALARYRIVHLATHGVMDSEHPERSGIALSMVDAAGQPRDGFLRAAEIYRLRLPVDLVVLSACRTALGREVRGEGVVGLTRAFLHAGAHGVLVSLWDVEDQATAELMTLFYREMLGQGRTPAAALQKAQNALRQTAGRQAPAFWAGFVLQGDWR